MTKYLAIVEKGENNYSAFSPDVSGCAATGRTVEETLANMKDALEFHLKGMAESGEQIPQPKDLSYYPAQISVGDIIAHVSVAAPEAVFA